MGNIFRYNMTGTNQTIDRNNVLEIDYKDNDERYRVLTHTPRNADNTVGYILQDRNTDEYLIAYKNTDIIEPDYQVRARDIELYLDGQRVRYPLHDLNATASHDASGIYTHKITESTVQIEYMDTDGVPQETIDAASDNWHVECDVVTK